MVIGGQAVLIYGEPRLTKDIDITIGLGPDHTDMILLMAKKAGFQVLVHDPHDFIRKTMLLPLLDQKSSIRIDMIFSFSPYELQAINRAVNVKILGKQVRFASLEDLIIHKIIAGRPRDGEDVKCILLKNRSYDRDYIIYWLSQFEESIGEAFLSRFKDIEKSV